ncbi:hypothetical protein ACFSGI_06260 [Paenibacillus nicotianae]|uniref:Butirosin biosynthesis protein H N-terminal domain-containing protein n=1 Tax=Paenibacillus nicotianae TaxID=1526551 RepID=A0ABW4UVH7_9BACL
MEFNLYYNNNQNCLQRVLSAMLIRKNIDPNQLWYQSGIYYTDSNDASSWEINPYFMEYDYFLKNMGIECSSFLLPTSEDTISKIKEYINKDNTIGVYVDISELPYCLYYQKEHESHAIEIIEIKKDIVTLCDHYYNYYGTISLQQLHLAIRSYIEHISNLCTIFFLSIDQDIKINVAECINNNIEVMNGKKIGTYSLKKEGSIGLSAIPKVRSKIISLLNLEHPDKFSYLDKLFKDIKEIAYSRYNFNVFLDSHQYSIDSEYSTELSNNWSVIANLILKSAVTNKTEIVLPNIEKRFNNIIDQEGNRLIRLEKLI